MNSFVDEQCLKIIIVSNEEAEYGTKDKMVVDTLRFIKVCHWKALPATVRCRSFKDQDELKKPSDCLANRSWNNYKEENSLETLKKKKNQYRWKEIDAAQIVLKERSLKFEGKEEFDSLAMSFNLRLIDAELSKKCK